MKSDFSQEYFINICKIISENKNNFIKESKMSKACSCQKWNENKKEYESKDISNCPFCGNKLINLTNLPKQTNENSGIDEQTLILG
jgi:hypothetical protein